MTGGREPFSRPSSRHGEARHPLTLPADAGRRASSQRDCHDRRPHPEGRRWLLPCSCRRKGGACRLSKPAHETMIAGSECVRGLLVKRCARRSAQERRAGPCATSAPLRFSGRCGVSPLEGVAGDRIAAPAQGKAFPLNSLIHSTRVIDFARFTTKRNACPRHVGLEFRQE